MLISCASQGSHEKKESMFLLEFMTRVHL